MPPLDKLPALPYRLTVPVLETTDVLMSDSDETSPDRSFEETLNRLEEIVERLEDDPPSLDEALDAYEEGVALANDCLSRLDEAEQRISELSIDPD
jgi:exodeoxyribonuclease VII small subunit